MNGAFMGQSNLQELIEALIVVTRLGGGLSVTNANGCMSISAFACLNDFKFLFGLVCSTTHQ